MPMVTERKNQDLPVSYCSSETESELSSDSESFKGYVDSERSKSYPTKKSSTAINDSPNASLNSTQEIDETDISTSDLVTSRKRRRSFSSSEESVEAKSRSVSPEITYGGSPVKYKLCKVDGTLLIIKKSMSSTSKRRSEKCSEQDITVILDSDSDQEIFDPVTKKGAKIVGSLGRESQNSTPKKLGTPSKTESLKREEVSLRIKLRRSTEQSNYKIQHVDNEETICRTSSRSTKGTPKKCGMIDCDEDHTVHAIQRASALKTPNKANVMKIGTPSTQSPRRTRRNSKNYSQDPPEIKSLHNKENESDIELDEDNEIPISRGRGRAKISAQPEFGTPAKQIKKLDDAKTPMSGRPRRNSKLVNYNSDALENSDNSARKTPEKKNLTSTPSSTRPRRNSRLVNYNYDSLEIVNESNGVEKQFETPEKKNLPATPRSARARRNTRLLSYDFDESDIARITGNDNELDNETDSVSSRGPGRRKLAAKLSMATPQKQIKKAEETSTPSSTRPRRNSRLVNYNYDGLEGIDVGHEKIEKAEESDDDMAGNGVGNRRRTRSTKRLPTRDGSATPQKQLKTLEEPMTPKRTSRKSAVHKVGEATPKRTPRRTATKQIEEEQQQLPKTPTTTARKTAIKNFEDEQKLPKTPTTTARKMAMKNVEDEQQMPKTPTTAAKKISKATTPSIKSGCLTPSMSRRTAHVGKPKTILEEARAQLHVSAVPKSLPCREEEFNDIYEFLERKLLDNNGGCIYISGVPGTGKTATVNEAIRCLKKLVAKGTLDNFDFIEINGMKLSEPRQAYVQILKQMNGQSATWEQAYQILEKRFTQSTAKRPMTLLLVDELDLLCNKRQDVVYNLLDWPAKTNAQLVVITIANTMDLPERVLMGRVTSRLGLTRLTFQPYNHKQLQEIVMARLKDSDAFKSEAIQLVARKVAAVSGDARRALDICRRATEIAELNSGKIVTMTDVNQALTEMIASAKVQAIKHCSRMERIFLQAVCAEVARTGVEEVSFQNVYRQLESLCSFEGLKVPNITQALGICARLGGNRLLLCEHSRTDTQQRILLNVSADDIHFAMQTINIA